MRRLETLAIVAGLAAAVLLLVGAVSASPPATTDGSASAAEQPLVSEESFEVVVPTPPAPVLESLPAAVAQALAGNGNTELILQDQLESQLPASVVALLMEHEAVLRIAETERPAP